MNNIIYSAKDGYNAIAQYYDDWKWQKFWKRNEFPIIKHWANDLKIGKVVLGTSYIEIHANQPVTEYKTMRLSGPDRLVIDIACQETDQKTRSVAIHKFGVAKIRIGVTPTNIRIVVDSSMIGFPAHTIATSDSGLRLNFK